MSSFLNIVISHLAVWGEGSYEPIRDKYFKSWGPFQPQTSAIPFYYDLKLVYFEKR